MNRFALVFVALGLACDVCAEKRFKDDFGREFVVLEPVDILNILEAAVAGVSGLELIALDPAQIKDGQGAIDGATITGRARTEAKEEVGRLLAALKKSIREAPEETYECFEPRHALRTLGPKKDVEIVLCFQCQQGIIRVGKDVTPFPMTGEAEKVFDTVFAAHGLAKAEKKKPNKSPEPTR